MSGLHARLVREARAERDAFAARLAEVEAERDDWKGQRDDALDAYGELSIERDQCRSERDEAVHHVKQLLADLEGWREGRDSMVGDEERAAEEFLVRVVSEGNVGKDGAQ